MIQISTSDLNCDRQKESSRECNKKLQIHESGSQKNIANDDNRSIGCCHGYPLIIKPPRFRCHSRVTCWAGVLRAHASRHLLQLCRLLFTLLVPLVLQDNTARSSQVCNGLLGERPGGSVCAACAALSEYCAKLKAESF